MRRSILVLGMIGALSACGGGDAEPDLLDVSQQGSGPDEFSVLPKKPLEMPQSYASLPQPTPGGRNRTDPTPEADVAIALGGNPGALTQGSGDGALVAHASRYGVEPDIRPRLAAADIEYRRENDGRLLERLFNVNVYYRAYEPMSLDQHRELERMRRAGVRTSGAPPDPARAQ